MGARKVPGVPQHDERENGGNWYEFARNGSNSRTVPPGAQWAPLRVHTVSMIFPFNVRYRWTHRVGGVTTSPCRLVKFRKSLNGMMSHTIRRGAHWAPARFWDFRNTVNGKMAEIGTNSPKMVQIRRLFRRAPNGRPYGCIRYQRFFHSTYATGERTGAAGSRPHRAGWSNSASR